jgi:sporulation protein YlmC with PRC-barrel domain
MRPPRRPRAAAMNGRLATVRAIAALTIFVLAVCSGTFRPAHAQGVQLLKVDVSVVASGYRASKLIGANVKNDKGEKIGAIDDIIIDKQKALFAVLEVGGFLGIGGRRVAVPYDQLVFDDTGTNITLPGATKEQLQGLQEFKYRTS